MECRPLDITLISATDLKDVNFLSKMDVYAVVSISGDSFSKSKQKTHVDKDSGPNPRWNYTIKFTVPDAAAKQNQLTLKIKLVSDRSFGDKEIGEVHVPIKELLDNYGDEKSENLVTYNVRLPSGKSKGTLSFSYKFGEKFTAPVQQRSGGHPAPPPQQGYGYPPPAAAPGYAYPQYQAAQPGYGYAMPPPQKPKKGFGGMGLGLGAGLLGGLLIGDMVSDVGEMAAYDAGFDDAGFDF
ncbi:protein SRC2 [Morus notabilis]|uniref:protein SRC2 n=2 Tax=Morus notabilis TaxID=981085 RepID=UPI000CECE41E|nr:protein SRC2 [Morus notabilis]